MSIDPTLELTEEQKALQAAVRQLCKRYPDGYWRELDQRREYPEEFVREMTEAGYLGALIPSEYGGGGLGVLEGSLILEAVNRSGANSAAAHAQMYVMGTLLRHGSDEQKGRYLPKIAGGELRLQAFGVTEPNSSSDTTRLQTTATRQGDHYVVNGEKIFISRVLPSDLMLLLARTTPLDMVEKRTQGLSVFLVDLKSTPGIDVRPIPTMLNHSTNAVHFNGARIPAESLVGVEGRGFHQILDGMNAERILIAAECIGDGRWFIEKAVSYANQRVVFERPIGQNQGVQFPIAKAHMAIEAADLMRMRAARSFDAGRPCGGEANMSKFLASEASWEAANVCMNTHGGYGFAVEYGVERKFRETRLYQTAPVTNNLVLAYVGEHLLGLPRSY